MGVTAAFAGVNVTDVRSTIPGWGASWHDVSLDREIVLSGAATLVLADLMVQGTILSGGPAPGTGRSYYRMVAGAGGWGKEIPAKSYANDLGVKLSNVLGDAAASVGEVLDTTSFDTSTRLGPAFVRPEDQACRLLEQLSPGAWYVGEDGKTRLGARPPLTIASTVARTSPLDPARGTLELASDSIVGILPGLVVDGLTVVDVEHTFDLKGGLRSKVWGTQNGAASRRLNALRKLFDQIDPGRKFRGVFEYRVVIQTGNRLNLQSVRASAGMPDLLRVPMWAGSGANTLAALGSRVLVGFIDQDPSRPVVLSYEDPDGPGWKPQQVELDASSLVDLGPSATDVLIGGTAAVVNVGPAPQALATSAPVLTALEAILTWVAALNTAMGGAADPPHVATAMVTPTSTLVTALGTTAPATTPTTVLKGT